MHKLFKSRVAAVATGAAVVVGLGATSATAAGLIGSDDIRNNAVQSADIRNNSLAAEDLERSAVGNAEIASNSIDSRVIQNGAVGIDNLSAFVRSEVDDRAEIQGVRQRVEALEQQLAAGYSGPNWGIVDRNVIGAGETYLRSGPSAASASGIIAPPLGVGSLGIRTATFGNQVDVAGNLVSELTAVGFSVFTTGENNAAAPNNMPSITFEIDPNLETSPRGYSSMVFAPNNSVANQWTDIDATADTNGAVWGLTGADMPCDINGARGTWTELQTALEDGGEPATIMTVQVTKGRDFAFSGAVDALKINDRVFDFEPLGVVAK